VVDGAVREMKDWPFGAALRGEASNRLVLRWLKTVVVSDRGKGILRCQVGIRKTSVSESLTTCRNKDRWHQNRGDVSCSGMSLAGARRLARWCPAWRRREPDLPLPDGT
jgi:hypothetical protein